MHRVTCLFVVIITLLTVCHGYSIEKIVGGSDAQEGDFPYQVSLRRNNMHLCGGSIVNELWILTAAHCVSGQNAMWITVIAGTNLLSEGGDSYQAEKLIAHKKYDPFTISYDIGLIRLASAIVFGPKVQPVGMPFKDSDEVESEEVESDVILSGWGRTSYPGGIPDVLQRINLRTISGESCKAAFSSIYLSVRDSNICTLTQKGEGACHGDSGGPLTTTNGTQIGIVSWGMPCAKGYPDVYTRVASFTDWIEEKIEQ